MKKTNARRALISGGSIAGPATAYWLKHYGFDVTLVERAPQVRMGGYPIDVRGSAIRVVDKMGMLPRVRAAHINTKKISMVDEAGKAFAVIKPDDLLGSEENVDVELPRWNLSSLLYDATRNSVDYQFNDSIASLEETSDGVHVTFQSGRKDTFDIVIGGDGMHSNTRRLVFGPEEPFLHYLGYTFAGFTMPNTAGLDQENVMHFADNRVAALYAVRNFDRLFAFFCTRRPYPANEDMRDVNTQRRVIRDTFADMSWRVPEMVDAFETADDIFCDSVAQIKMPTWSKGRVALVGDAAYGPSFMTGQGTSMALVGAYILAGELNANKDHGVAFERYQNLMRKYVEDCQSMAQKDNWRYIPHTKEDIEPRRKAFADIMRQAGNNEKALANRKIYNSIEVPEYQH